MQQTLGSQFSSHEEPVVQAARVKFLPVITEFHWSVDAPPGDLLDHWCLFRGATASRVSGCCRVLPSHGLLGGGPGRRPPREPWSGEDLAAILRAGTSNYRPTLVPIPTIDFNKRIE